MTGTWPIEGELQKTPEMCKAHFRRFYFTPH